MKTSKYSYQHHSKYNTCFVGHGSILGIQFAIKHKTRSLGSPSKHFNILNVSNNQSIHSSQPPREEDKKCGQRPLSGKRDHIKYNIMLDAVDIPTCGPVTNRYTQVCTRKSELKTHKFGQQRSGSN